MTIIIAQLINFIAPLNNLLIISNIVILIIYSFFYNNILKETFKVDTKIFAISLLVMLVNIYGSDFSDDINHYHYGFISNADGMNFIWGHGFLHPLYSTAPSWLIGHSYFNFDHTRLQDIHVLNGIILFLTLGLFLSELNLNINKVNLYNPIYFSLIIFILFKYTRLKEFGIDRPSILLFCFLIYYYLKYFLKNNNEVLKNFIILFLISISIISIKIIYLPILIIPLVVLLKFRKNLIKLDLKYIIVVVAIFGFLLKNLLGSGCLIFPVEFSCINFLSWSNFSGIKEFTIFAEAFNKSWWQYEGDLSREEYIKNFNWFNTWFQRGKIELLDLFLTFFLIIFISYISFEIKLKKKYSKNQLLNNLKIILVSIILFSIFIYIMKNPVIRMNHHILISLMILSIIFMFESNVRQNRKKIIFLFITTALLFNFSKNIIRISSNNFVNNPELMIIDKITSTEKNTLGIFTYYIGWYGKGPIANNYLDDHIHRKLLIFNIIENK